MTQRQRLIAVAVAVILLIIAGTAAEALSDMTAPSRPVPARTAPRTGSSAPVTTYVEITESEPLPYTEKTRHDPLLSVGTTYIETEGVDGVIAKTYRIKLVDNVEVSRALLRQEITKEPVAEVTLIGTHSEGAPQTGDCFPVYDYDGDGRPC